jgi:hypothetical protein
LPLGCVILRALWAPARLVCPPSIPSG